jgi:hypothetical protein
MSDLQAQCWICPHCHDDKHHEQCDPEELKQLLAAAQAEARELAEECQRLRGLSFSDRMYEAIRARMEKAEAGLARVRDQAETPPCPIPLELPLAHGKAFDAGWRYAMQAVLAALSQPAEAVGREEYAVTVDRRDLFDKIVSAWREGTVSRPEDQAESWRSAYEYAESVVREWIGQATPTAPTPQPQEVLSTAAPKVIGENTALDHDEHDFLFANEPDADAAQAILSSRGINAGRGGDTDRLRVTVSAADADSARAALSPKNQENTNG